MNTRQEPESPSSLRVLSWNMRWNSSSGPIAKETTALAEMPWDVAMLQEVSPGAWGALQGAGLTAHGMSAFQLADAMPDGKRPHGVAILVRNGLALNNPAPLTGLPRPGRGLGATLDGLAIPVSVCSWHAPSAAAGGPAIKMQGYLSFLGWIARQRGAVIVRFDSNHWELGTALELSMPEDPANRWYLEQRFFGADPPHRLRDSFRDYLTRNPDRYAELCATVPANGPLATSYTRGSKSNPIKDRFDYVFISDEFECVDMRHDYDAGLAAGSDHGIISCEVVLA